MEVLGLFLASAGGAAVIKLIESVSLWLLNRRAKLTDDQKAEKLKEEAQREQEQRDIACTVNCLKTANRVILHDRIKYLGKGYIKVGSVDLEDLSDLLEMHKIYHNDLDGNGKLDRLMGEVQKLPIRQ